jgi:hypothetical protein
MRRCTSALFLTGVALLAAAPSPAGVVRPIRDIGQRESHAAPVIDDTGSTVVLPSFSDPFGTNPRRAAQLQLWDVGTGAGFQVGNLEHGVAANVYSYSPWIRLPWVSVTDDGQTLAFVSSSDPRGLRTRTAVSSCSRSSATVRGSCSGRTHRRSPAGT